MRLSHTLASAMRPVSSVRATLFPDLCLGCGVQVAAQGTLCPDCWPKISFIERPFCEVSGAPFGHDFGDKIVSAEVLTNPPRYDHARAVAIHDDLARRLVTRLKYGDRTDLAPWMAQWMVKAGHDMLEACDIVIPVPLHRWRYWSRRYNQSAELARAIAQKTGKPMAPHALIRTRATRQQVGLGAREREANVRGAFKVPESARIDIQGRHVVLVDDVLTTGATLDAACKALRKAKAAQIDVLTFSRVASNL